MANTWLNNDGLYIKYGTTEGATSKGGQILDAGPYRIVEIPISYTDVASASQTIIHDTIVIPKYARVDFVDFVTTTAWDSAADNFVFNVGLVKTDRSTAYDVDAFIAALPQASMDPAGDFQRIDVNHTYKGSSLGTTMTENAYIAVDYDTGAPTAGAGKLRIYYFMTA